MTWHDTASIRGTVAELMFEAYALQTGYEAYRPIREDGPVDLLMEVPLHWAQRLPLKGDMFRIQIKRVYLKKEKATDDVPIHRTINLKRRDGSRYTSDDIDAVAAVDVDTSTIWLIPFDRLVDSKTGVSLGRLRLTDAWDPYVVQGAS